MKVAVRPSSVVQFGLTPSTTQVTWSVTETNGGTVTAAGSYGAPAFSGVFHVVATSVGNPLVTGQATATVDSGVTISGTTPVSMTACDPVQLTATVTGSVDTGLLWSTPAACGTVTATGIFKSARGTGSCVVTAQAHADVAKTAAVTINVSIERVVSVVIAPASVALAPAGTASFAANVTTSCGTFPAGT